MGVPVVVDAVATGTPAGLGDSAPVAVGGGCGGGSWWCSIFTGLDLNFILNVRPPPLLSDQSFVTISITTRSVTRPLRPSENFSVDVTVSIFSGGHRMLQNLVLKRRRCDVNRPSLVAGFHYATPPRLIRR